MNDPARRPRPLLPAGCGAYLVPYGVFLLLVDLQNRVSGGWVDALMLLRVAVPAALVIGYARAGRYPELRDFAPRSAWLADAAVGLAIAALWMAPYLLAPGLPRGEPFDTTRLGGAALAVRLVGFVGVTPFVEELFVRSFLHRYAEVWNEDTDFRSRPVGRYQRQAFWVTVVWFALSHAPWEWLVALPTGVILNLWLYHRGRLGSVIRAHAVANGALWLAVVLGPPSWRFLL